MEENDRPIVGAIYPDDAWVDVETRALIEDYTNFMPSGVKLMAVATPIPAVDLTLENNAALADNGDIEEAARRLAKYGPSCFAYYCTTISFIRGPGGDADIISRITAATGKPATTTSTAMIAAFRELNVAKVVLASPYLPDVEEKFVEFIQEHGIEVLNSVSLCLKDGHSIVPPEQILQLAESADRPDADAVFIGCTGQRLAVYIDEMEKKLGKPLLTANQVTSWHALQVLDVEPYREDRGLLFRACRAE